MIDRYRLRIFPTLEEKKKKIYLLIVIGKFGLVLGDLDDFVIEILPILQKEKKKKKISKPFRISEKQLFSCREQFQLAGGLVDHSMY